MGMGIAARTAERIIDRAIVNGGNDIEARTTMLSRMPSRRRRKINSALVTRSKDT